MPSGVSERFKRSFRCAVFFVLEDVVDDKDLEYEADRLLRKNKALNKANGIYRECDLERTFAREISMGIDFVWSDQVILQGEEMRISLGEVIDAADLTPSQRKIVRLMRRYHRQVIVAQILGISRQAVSKSLSRSYLLIRAAFKELNGRYPSNFALWLFNEELCYKRRLIYRKCVKSKKFS